MTHIKIDDDKCWMCGEAFSNEKGKSHTTHHCLPVNMRPVKNIMIPIHESCHNKINSTDITSLTAFAYRLQKEIRKMNLKTEALVGLLKGFSEEKIGTPQEEEKVE